MHKISWDGYLFSQPDSAFFFAQILFDFALEKDLKEVMARALRTQGVSWYVRSDYPKAMDFYQRSLNLSEEISDYRGMTSTLNNIGIICTREGNYPKALAYYQRCLKIKEEISDKSGMAGVLNNIGIIYTNQGDHANAMDYYLRCLQIYEELSDESRMATALSNIGLVYQNLGDFSKAMEYYERSLQIKEAISDKRGIANTLNNMGEIFMTRNDFSQAMDYYLRSLRIKDEISDKRGMVNSFNNIGKVHLELGQYQTAVSWCLKGLRTSREINILEGQRSACQCLYEAFKAIGDDAKALEYHELISVLDDSLQAEETTVKLQQMEFARQMVEDSLAYEQEKIRRELLYTQALHKKNNQRNAFIFSGLGIIILSLLLFFFYRYKSRKNRIISEQKIRQLEEEKKLLAIRSLVEGQKEERKRIATELHDSLGVLLSVARMQFSSVKDTNPRNKTMIEKATQFLEQASSEVRKISHNLMPGLLTKLGLYEALEDLFDKLSEMEGIQAVFDLQGTKRRLAENTEYMIYRIIQEMVNNALKHADARKIELHMEILPDRLDILFSDDGKGFTWEEQDQLNTIGLQSIFSRVKFLDGTISCDTAPGNGTRYRMQIPV